MNLLVTVNAGSSSLRLDAFPARRGAAPLCSLHHDGEVRDAAGLLAGFAARLPPASVCAVVHRVVHGGSRLALPCVVDAAVEHAIEAASPLAPLHNPAALAWIRACREVFAAGVTQVAVFGTGFFADLPEVARTYALPHTLCAEHGLRRYGFHGLAHAALWQAWCEQGGAATARVVTLQLGSGCSAAAIAAGRPLDTSMGFSPLEGLVMGTRSGDLDPGLVLYLQRALGWSPADLEHLLSHDSGLRGISGLSNDMRELLASDAPRARLAVEVFCYRVRKYIGAYLAVLGGADAILCGGGIAEHSPAIRGHILADLAWAGVSLDTYANAVLVARDGRISAPRSAVAVHVFAVDEARMLRDAALPLMAADALPAQRAGGREDIAVRQPGGHGTTGTEA